MSDQFAISPGVSRSYKAKKLVAADGRN